MGNSDVVIFGATSAMAIATARAIVSPNRRVFLIGRNRDRLQSVADDLTTRGCGSVSTFVADLKDVGKLDELIVWLGEHAVNPDLVFLFHGVLGDQPSDEQSVEATLHILQANFISHVAILTKLAPFMAQHKRGTIVCVSSVAGDRGRRSNYIYGSAKGGLNVFLSGFRARMAGCGVHVMTVKPGFVDSVDIVLNVQNIEATPIITENDPLSLTVDENSLATQPSNQIVLQKLDENCGSTKRLN